MNLQIGLITRTPALLASVLLTAAFLAAPATAAEPEDAGQQSFVEPHPAPGTEHEARENSPVSGVLVAKPVTRSAVMAAGKRWVDKRVPYSNHPPFLDGYRRDCSGFVSYAWATDQNYTTNTLHKIGDRIKKESLRPGDMLLWQNPRWPAQYGHVRIFGGWLDTGMTRYWVYEQTPPRATYREYSWARTERSYLPYRYKKIIDDDVRFAPPPPEAVLTSEAVVDMDGDGVPDKGSRATM